MKEAKNTQRALVRIGFDGRVYKQFRGPNAEIRFENEVRVLRYLEQRDCPFVPRLLEVQPESLEIVTSNCGTIVDHLPESKIQALFAELEEYGVRHEDAFLRNITYRQSDGRFCVIDFEFATIIGHAATIDEQPTCDGARFLIQWSGQSDRGKMRPNNEDAFLALLLNERGVQHLGKQGLGTSDRKSDYIFAVSDGMGGAKSGEFASRIALEKIISLLPKHFDLPEKRFQSYSSEILKDLFENIHASMIEQGRYDRNCRDMGATLTLVWVRQGFVYFGHVGDCRLVHFSSSKKTHQLTDDHTFVGWLRKNGQLNEREARGHPRKNVLTHALGAGHRKVRPQLGQIAIESGDRFLISSDGVIDGIWDHRMSDLLGKSIEGGASRADMIVQEAVYESGRDNATAIILEFGLA